MLMEEGLDTGPMLSMEALPILPQDTTGSLHDKLAALGGRMIVDALGKLDTLASAPQPEQGVTYAAKISKEEARLDFAQPAEVLARKVRAFNPFPGAFGHVSGVAIKIWGAEPAAGKHGAQPGKVLSADDKQGIVVACGEGALRLSELQKPGGKRLAAGEFLKGFSLENLAFE
jgi:methionyl-tRNA formyltransferase